MYIQTAWFAALTTLSAAATDNVFADNTTTVLMESTTDVPFTNGTSQIKDFDIKNTKKVFLFLSIIIIIMVILVIWKHVCLKCDFGFMRHIFINIYTFCLNVFRTMFRRENRDVSLNNCKQ